MVSLNQFSYQPFSFILYELPDVSIEIQNLHTVKFYKLHIQK